MKRIAYLDGLRISATIGVILLHLAARPWETLSVQSSSWMFFNVLDSAVRWAVPLFVMISGALFLNPEKEISFTLICKKNLLRLGTAFAFWSLLYTLCDLRRGLSLRSAPLTFLKGEYHMWFLFLIGGLYLFVPLLRRLTRTKKRTELFLALFGGAFILIPRAVHLLSVFGFCVPLGDLILKAMNVNAVSFSYFFVFVLGHYLFCYDLSKVARRLLYAGGILGFLTTALLTAWHSMKIGMPSGSFYTYISIHVLLMASALFVFAKAHWKKERKGIRYLSRLSFGTYLSHVLVLDGLAPLGITPWLVFPLGAAVFFAALGLSFVLFKIPVLKDYVI